MTILVRGLPIPQRTRRRLRPHQWSRKWRQRSYTQRGHLKCLTSMISDRHTIFQSERFLEGGANASHSLFKWRLRSSCWCKHWSPFLFPRREEKTVGLPPPWTSSNTSTPSHSGILCLARHAGTVLKITYVAARLWRHFEVPGTFFSGPLAPSELPGRFPHERHTDEPAKTQGGIRRSTISTR